MHLKVYENYNLWDNPLYRWIYSFHMPLFMMISGFFSVKTGDSFVKYASKKFRQLVWPALTFGVIFIFSYFYLANNGAGNIFSTYAACYWFLKSAFLCTLVYFAATRFPSRKAGYAVTLAVSLFMHWYNVNLMYPAFLTGVALSRHREALEKNAMWIAAAAGVVFAVIFTKVNGEVIAESSLKILKCLREGGPEVLGIQAARYACKVVLGLSGSLCVIGLFVAAAKRLPSTRAGRILGSWGMLTLGVYLLQAVLLEQLMMKTVNLAWMSPGVFNYVATPLVAAGVTLVCIVITKALKLSPWLSFLFLGAPCPVRGTK